MYKAHLIDVRFERLLPFSLPLPDVCFGRCRLTSAAVSYRSHPLSPGQVNHQHEIQQASEGVKPMHRGVWCPTPEFVK